LQIANYFLLTANPNNEISSTIIKLAVSQKQFAICNLTLLTGQVTSNVLYNRVLVLVLGGERAVKVKGSTSTGSCRVCGSTPMYFNHLYLYVHFGRGNIYINQCTHWPQSQYKL